MSRILPLLNGPLWDPGNRIYGTIGRAVTDTVDRLSLYQPCLTTMPQGQQVDPRPALKIWIERGGQWQASIEQSRKR